MATLIKTRAENSLADPADNSHGEENEEKIKSRTCSTCGKVFARSTNVVVHMRLHRGERPFKCITCGKAFCRSDHLKNHELVHVKKKPYHCDSCGETFKRKDHLKYHQINNHGLKIYLNELKCYTRTMQNESQKKTILCDVCGIAFANERSLKNHFKIHSNQGRFLCKFCGKSFNQSSNLNIHLRKHTGDTPYKCLSCDLSFATSAKLKTHARKHTGDLPFACQVCGRLFGETHLLKMHMRIHNSHKSYRCNYCNKIFTHGSTLRAHIRTHTGAKPYKCDQCGDAFAQISSLSYHKRTHNGEKPYSCHICGNSYTRMATLNIHLTRHTGRKRISCPHCEFKCDAPKQLRKHASKVHSEMEDDINLLLKQKCSHPVNALYANTLDPNHSLASVIVPETAEQCNMDEKGVYDVQHHIQENFSAWGCTKFIHKPGETMQSGNVEKLPVVKSLDSFMTLGKSVKCNAVISHNSSGIASVHGSMKTYTNISKCPDPNIRAPALNCNLQEMPMPSEPYFSAPQSLQSGTEARQPAFDCATFHTKPGFLFQGVICPSAHIQNFSHDVSPLYSANSNMASSNVQSILNVSQQKTECIASGDAVTNPYAHTDTESHMSISQGESHLTGTIEVVSSAEPALNASQPGQIAQQHTHLPVPSATIGNLITLLTSRAAAGSDTTQSRLPHPEMNHRQLVQEVLMADESVEDFGKFNDSHNGRQIDTTGVESENAGDENCNSVVKKGTKTKRKEKKKEPASIKEKHGITKSDITQNSDYRSGKKKSSLVLTKINNARKTLKNSRTLRSATRISSLHGIAKECQASVKNKRAGKSQLELSKSDYSVKPVILTMTDSSSTVNNSVKRSRAKRNKGPVKCPTCGQKFSRTGNLTTHMRLHTGERPYACGICDKKYTRSDHLKAHMGIHHEDLSLLCNHCGDKFASSDQLNAHTVEIHEGKNPFACNVCEFSCVYLSELKDHVKEHEDGNQFQCDVCKICFNKAKELKKHMKSHDGSSPFVCHICDKAFKESSCLKLHRMTKHTGEKHFKCGVCRDAFVTAAKLQRHMRTHSGTRPYTCEFCGKMFIDTSLLKMHVRIHTNEKPFKCKHCNQCFTHRSTLRAHLRIHTGNKPYTCGICSASFAQVSSLKYHKRRHDGLKPYTCHICGNSYTRSTTLNIHLTHHTGQNRFSCSRCKYSCDTPHHLRKHLTKVHRQLGDCVAKTEKKQEVANGEVHKMLLSTMDSKVAEEKIKHQHHSQQHTHIQQPQPPPQVFIVPQHSLQQGFILPGPSEQIKLQPTEQNRKSFLLQPVPLPSQQQQQHHIYESNPGALWSLITAAQHHL